MSEEKTETEKSTRRRLTRGEQMGLVAVIAMGIIMVLGFVVVAVTIAVRMSDLASETPAPAEVTPLSLPAGAEVVSSALDDERLALTVREEAGLVIYVIALPGGDLVSRTALGSEDRP